MSDVYNRAVDRNLPKDTIDAYKANLLKNDIARTNLFLWKLNTLPKTLSFEDEDNPNPYEPLLGDLEVFVKSTSFSGMNVTQWDRNTEGFTRKIGIDTGYSSDMQVEFYDSPDLKIYMMFENWLQSVLPKADILEYYDNYIGNATIHQLDRNLNPTRQFTFNEMYPNAVSPIMYSAMGAIMTFTVNFTFRTWSSELIGDEKPKKEGPVGDFYEKGHPLRPDIGFA